MKELTPLSVAWDAWLAKRAGLNGLMFRQRQRWQELVSFARQHSRYYREKYRQLPADIENIQQLPHVSKPELMSHFEDWITDPDIRLGEVEAFVADKNKIGETFQGRYVIFTTSGSSGTPAILIQDEAAQAVINGLTYVRGLGSVSLSQYWQVFQKGGRQAALFATGGHFLGVTMIQRRRQAKPWRARMSRIISVLKPLPEVVRELNEFQPAMLGGYATMLTLLAEEQQAGRLHIAPVLITSSGETLSEVGRRQIESAFGCMLTESYGCSEATPLTLTCPHQRLHVNIDWFILEAVDEHYRPVPPGQPSYTVLITNLANHVQPIIRYELGDSLTVSPDPCPCGSPLPSVQVIGRTDEILELRSPAGQSVRILPLAIWSVIKETPGVLRFQVIQTAPTKLKMRLEVKAGSHLNSVWESIEQRVCSFLGSQGLSNIAVLRSSELPSRDPFGGKFRHVWAEKKPHEKHDEGGREYPWPEG